MIIKRDDIINASYYFPIDYDEFVEVANKSSKRFYAFNGFVFDKQQKYKELDYKKAICEIEETDGDGFNYILNEQNISNLQNNMIKNYKIVTLCGSTKFKDEFMEAQKKLTLEGNIVISVGLFGHSGDNEVWAEGTKEMLDDMHKRKIDLADEIFVVNVDGYIGNSTRSEIEYAIRTNKKVNYLVPLDEYVIVYKTGNFFRETYIDAINENEAIKIFKQTIGNYKIESCELSDED